MRKIYYLFALLLLVMGSTAVRGQKIISAILPGVEDLSVLQHGGAYVLQNVNSGQGEGYLWENVADNNKVVITKYTQESDFVNNPISASMVWTLEIEETAGVKTYSFKSATGKYIQPMSSSNTGVNKGKFDIVKTLNKPAADPITIASRWGIKNTGGGNNYFNGNPGLLTGWSDGHPYQIRPVTTADVSVCTVTYVCKSGELDLGTVTASAIIGTDPIAPTIKYYTYASMDFSGTIAGDMTINVEYSKNYPFETTTIINGQFAPDTKWYTNKIHPGQDKYWQYTANDVIVNATPSYTDDAAYQWCFTGNTVDGFKIYNKKAGANTMMVYGNSNPFMKENATDQNTWVLVPTTVAGNTNGACFKRKDQNDYINHQGGTLKYWDSTDNGSTNNFILYTPTWLLEAADWASCPEGVVGSSASLGQVQSTYADYVANPSDANSLLVKAAIEAMEAETPIAITADKYYRLINVARKVGSTPTVLAVNPNNPTLTRALASATSDISMLWKFETVDGGYKIMNANAQTYLGAAYFEGNTQQPEAGNVHLKDNANAFVYEATALGTGQYNIKDKINLPLHAAGGLNIVGYAGVKGTPSAWYILPVENIDVAISEAGYSTLNAPFAVTLPQGVTAYGVTSSSANSVGLTPLTGSTLKANTPVVLKADAATYSLPIATTAGAEITGNKLSGTTIAQNVTAESYILALINKDEPTEGVCFYKLDQASNKVGANKAYLPQSAIVADAPEKVLNFVFGDVLGIGDAIVTEGSEKEVYYDLSGRRVKTPSKGIYITKKGKKVIF